MAHRFAYSPTGINLTGTLGDIPIWVDGTFVDVRLTAPGGVVVLNERYYAYGGSVKLYDLGSLIENDMRKSGYTYADYTIALLNKSGGTDASCVMHLLYCDRLNVCTDLDVFLSENFLTTLSYRRIAPKDILSLFFLARKGENTDVKVAYRWRSSAVSQGTHVDSFVKTGTAPSADSVQQINISQSDMVSDACHSYGIKADSMEIVSFTVSVGQRSVTCFVDRSLDDANNFYFRNCFNCWDLLAVPMTTTAKTEVERSTAVVNTTSQFYNQRTTKTYEVESGALTSDEANWIDQFIASYEVFRLVPNDCDDTEPALMQHVIITDSTCEVSDGDEKPPVVKFTWRYADNRPLVHLSASLGIFTSPFNPTFA